MEDEITLAEDGADLCIHCLKPVGYNASFCNHCRAPLSFLAGNVPYYSVFAQGFIFRTAVQEPKNLTTVLGVWAMFGYMASYGALFAVIGICAIYQSTMNYLDYRSQLRIDRKQGEASLESG